MEMTFPEEIWMEIFKRLDRPKLMELRLVCHYFYNIIEGMLNKSLEWQELAYESIWIRNLTRTMQRAYPYDYVTHRHEVDDPIIWRGTYLSFKKWQKVLEYEPRKDTIVPASSFGSISCIATFDKFIAIAFHNGMIANYTIEDISQPFYIAVQKTGIVQIEFWYSNGEVLIVTVGDDHTLKFWDLNNKVEIATASIHANSICSGEYRHFCIAELDGVLTSYERVGNLITAGPTIEVENEQVIAHTTSGKYIVALSYINKCTKTYTLECVIENGKLNRLEYVEGEELIRLPDNLKATLDRLIMPNISLYFIIGRDSIGSTNYYNRKWHEHNLFQRFGYQVRCVALHAQILMLGLEDGSIHLLHIEHYGDVRRLEETIENSRRIEVDTVPILHLTVLEVEKKPCIVAVTEKEVHLLNFF